MHTYMDESRDLVAYMDPHAHRRSDGLDDGVVEELANLCLGLVAAPGDEVRHDGEADLLVVVIHEENPPKELLAYRVRVGDVSERSLEMVAVNGASEEIEEANEEASGASVVALL